MAKIQQSHAIKSIKTLQIDFVPFESNIFHINKKKSLEMFYNSECMDLINRLVSETAASLVGVCAVTGEYPIIRYFDNPNKSFEAFILPKMIAEAFQYQLDAYARDNDDFQPASSRPRSIFLVTDRTLDLYSPILHEFTYQAMAYDVVPFKDDGIYRYSALDEKGMSLKREGSLSDDDIEWVSMRHLHIADASQAITNRINELISNNSVMVDRNEAKSASDLLHIVAHLKDFDEDRRRVTLHKTLIEQCLNINQQRHLSEIAELEQICIADGITIDGDACKTLIDDIIQLLASNESSIYDKFRLILIYSIYRGGIIKEDFEKLMSHSNIDKHDFFFTVLNNFNKIGLKPIKQDLKTKPPKNMVYHELEGEGAYNTSRFIPSMKSLVSQAINGKLSDALFPYVKDKPVIDGQDDDLGNGGSLRNQKHRAAWSKNTTSSAPRQRIFLFVSGGITYSEMRSAYELEKQYDRDVYYGGSEIINPEGFINSVYGLTVDRRKLGLDYDNLKPDAPPSYLLQPDPLPQSRPQTRPQGQAQSAPVVQQVKPLSTAPSTASVPEPKKEKKKKHGLRKFLR